METSNDSKSGNAMNPSKDFENMVSFYLASNPLVEKNRKISENPRSVKFKFRRIKARNRCSTTYSVY
jgi:hypothetical protein